MTAWLMNTENILEFELTGEVEESSDTSSVCNSHMYEFNISNI
jgi:hypothetical protein